MDEYTRERYVAGPSIATGDTAGLSRFTWRSAFAGVVVALALQLTLTVLGVAVGFAASGNLAADAGARSVRLAASLWYLGSMAVSIFFGGLVAGLTARDLSRSAGALEGLIVWATTLVLTVTVLTFGVDAVLGMVGVNAGNAAPSGADPARLGAIARDARIGTWAALGGLVVSSLAGILGGVAGAAANRRRVYGGRQPRAAYAPRDVVRGDTTVHHERATSVGTGSPTRP